MCKNTLVLFRHGVLQVGVCGARIRESGVEVKFERVRAVVSAGMKWRKWVVGTEQEDIARLENVRCNEGVSTSSATTDNNSNIVQTGASNGVHHCFLIGPFARTGDETKPNAIPSNEDCK